MEPLKGVRGAPDLLPPRSKLYERVVEAGLEVFRRFGYEPIETPAFEATELFERGLDSGSDIVTKEMYTFKDKKDRSLTLRPDMTAPVVRSILEHNLHRESSFIKLYYRASVFRHERPQAGRQRQFTQIGVEAVGSPGPEIDAEVIQLADAVYRRVGLQSVDLALNSIGHPGCRAAYLPKLKEFLKSHRAELCADCQRKIETNPLRTFDCKIENDRRIMEDAPTIGEHLCDECADHIERVKGLLTSLEVKFREEPRLVRGLDYYTRTTFEFTASGLGSQDAIGAGGRYDGLAESLGGPPLPGIGFGLGVDRIVLALEASGVSEERELDVYVVCIGVQARQAGLVLAGDLRERGLRTDLDFSGRAIRAQFKAADRANARYAVVIGERELADGTYTVRDMSSGEEDSVSSEAVTQHLKERLT